MIKLDRLINVLGGYGARLYCAPRSREAELRSVTLYDSTDPATADVLLAVGVETSEQAEQLLRSTQASVVVFRFAELADDAVSVAIQRDVAVVLVEPTVSWGQFAGVVYGLILEGHETAAGRGPSDLFALADALAESVGSPVTIENHHSRVLAYSSQRESADRARLATILSKRVPEEVRHELSVRGVFDHVAVSDEPLFVDPFEPGDFHGRVVMAVRAGRELLGSIWVETSQPLSEPQQAALVEGARTAALHLLRTRARADLERQVESDLVIGLLEGSADAPAVISQLGLRSKSFRVVAVQPHTDGEQNTAALLAFEWATTGFGWTRSGRSTLFANTVYTILPCGDDVREAREWARSLVTDLPPEVAVFVGIGGVADALQLASSRQEADESLAVHTSPNAPVVVYDDAWHEILLRRLRATAAAGRTPTRGPVVELRRHDAAHNTRYVDTLRAWLECQGDLGAAAARLSIHPNTVRYRIKKMAEVTTLDLNDPDKRLAMIIALAAG